MTIRNRAVVVDVFLLLLCVGGFAGLAAGTGDSRNSVVISAFVLTALTSSAAVDKYLSTFRFDPLNQGRELVGISPCYTSHITFARKSLGDCPTCRVACTNNNDRFLLHCG